MRTPIWLAGLGALVIVAVLAALERSGSPRREVLGAASGPALRLALDEIQGDQIAAHLQFLADDLLEGRAPSTQPWDYTGAVSDVRFLAELGWRIANAPDMPAYHAGEQFARPRLSSTS